MVWLVRSRPFDPMPAIRTPERDGDGPSFENIHPSRCNYLSKRELLKKWARLTNVMAMP